MRNLFSFVLAMLLLLSCVLAGCTPANNTENTSPEETPFPVTTPEDTSPEQTTPGTDIELPTTKTLSSVSITSGESDTERLAAAELKKHLEIKGVRIDAGGFPITLSIDPTLGDDCYRIQGAANVTEEQNNAEYINITGGNGRGVFYGVIRFLEEYAGTRFFTYELETHTADPVTVPASVLIEYQPVFEYRYTSWNAMTCDPLFCVKSGMNGNHGGITEEMGGHLSYAAGLGVHTFGVLSETTYPYPGYAPNPCLTDPVVLATVIKNVRAALEKDPTVNIISVSQNDKEEYCHCENCAAIDEEEGSPAGTLLRFVNAVAENIAEDYPNVTVDTLAYKYTRKPPKITKPAPNVCVRLCSIECHFSHPLTTMSCDTCAAFRNDLVGWGEICNNVYIWDYTTNFRYYLYTFPNLHVLRANMKFFADNNVKGVFEQGNGQSVSGEFGELRAYLLAKLMMNPYMSSEEYYTHMDEFLAAYYGEGWSYIRKYINTFTRFAQLSEKDIGIYSHPFLLVPQKTVALYENDFNAWWDAAEAAAGDRLEYVQRSRWQLRYLMLYLHPNEEEARKLIADAKAVKLAWREGYWNVNDSSDLTLPPDQWDYS